MLHALLGIEAMDALNTHPKAGASWEGLIVEAIIDHLGLQEDQVHFWATHGGAELDLLLVRGAKRAGIEIKRTSAPKVTRSMRIAIDDLGLDEAVVVHAGRESYPLGERVRAVSARRLGKDLGLDDYNRR